MGGPEELVGCEERWGVIRRRAGDGGRRRGKVEARAVSIVES